MNRLDERRQEGRKEEARIDEREKWRKGFAHLLIIALTGRFGLLPREVMVEILAAKRSTLKRWAMRGPTAPSLQAVLGPTAPRPQKKARPRKPTRAAHA